jgi:hypothetical protein
MTAVSKYYGKNSFARWVWSALGESGKSTQKGTLMQRKPEATARSVYACLPVIAALGERRYHALEWARSGGSSPMRLGRLKDIIGFTLVGLHLIAIGLCFLWLRERMSLQSFQLTILTITPITALYALAYLKETARYMFIDTPSILDIRVVTYRFAILSILFTTAFSVAILYTIYSFAFGSSTQNADDLKLSLSIVETALGAFLGFIAETLFGKDLPQEETRVK